MALSADFFSDAIFAKLPSLTKAKVYADGDHAEVFASARLSRALGKYGKSFNVNFCGKVISAVNDRLEVSNVTAPADQRATEAVQSIWSVNQLDQVSEEIHESALVYGESFVMAWPSEDGGLPVLHALDPEQTVVIYDETGLKRVAAARLWAEDDKTLRMNIYDAENVYRFEAERTHSNKNLNWVLLEEIPHTFGAVPIFQFRTSRPLGKPEHEDAYGLQDILQKLVSTQMSATDYAGAPQRYALANPDGVTDGLGEDYGEEDEHPASVLQSGPGELWYLDGIKQVGQFDSADPEAFLKPYQSYLATLSAVTSTPLFQFEAQSVAPSGEALRAAESPLTLKIEARQESFGATWQEVLEFLLSLEGITATVLVEWKPAQMVSDTEAWNAAILKKNAGLPVEVILAEQGYSTEQIREVTESAEFRKESKLQALDVIGTTIQRLGAAQQLGVVDPEASKVVSDLISSIVSDLDLA